MNYEISGIDKSTSCNSESGETFVYLHGSEGAVLELQFDEMVANRMVEVWVSEMNNPMRLRDSYHYEEIIVCEDGICESILTGANFKCRIRGKSRDILMEFFDYINNPEKVSKEMLWNEYVKLSKEMVVKKQSIINLEIKRDDILRRMLLE